MCFLWSLLTSPRPSAPPTVSGTPPAPTCFSLGLASQLPSRTLGSPSIAQASCPSPRSLIPVTVPSSLLPPESCPHTSRSFTAYPPCQLTPHGPLQDTPILPVLCGRQLTKTRSWLNPALCSWMCPSLHLSTELGCRNPRPLCAHSRYTRQAGWCCTQNALLSSPPQICSHVTLQNVTIARHSGAHL